MQKIDMYIKLKHMNIYCANIDTYSYIHINNNNCKKIRKYNIYMACVIIYANLSITMQEESSLIQSIADGQSIFFQCLVIRCLACNRHRFINFLSWGLRANVSGKRPRIQTSGRIGMSLWMMWEIVLILS